MGVLNEVLGYKSFRCCVWQEGESEEDGHSCSIEQSSDYFAAIRAQQLACDGVTGAASGEYKCRVGDTIYSLSTEPTINAGVHSEEKVEMETREGPNE